MISSTSSLIRVSCNLCGADEATSLFRKDSFSYVRCKRCGLIYVNPRTQDLRGWHKNRYREGRDGTGTENDVSRQYESSRMIRMERELNRYDNYRSLNRLLDVGCSAGAFLKVACRAGWQATGVDISETCARIGREREGLDIRLGAIAESAFPEEQFDIVRMNNVIEHLPDPLSDLREAYRVLRPDGLLVLATINARSLAAWLSGSDWRYYDPYCHVYVFTPKTLSGILQRAGFRDVKIGTHGFRWGSYREGYKNRKRLQQTLALISRLSGYGHRMRATATKPKS